MASEPQNSIVKKIAITFVVGCIVFYLLRTPLSVISINFFLFTDSLVKLSSSFNPIIMWVILGLFIGLLYGSFAAWKKYRLEFKLNLISIGIFILFFALLFLVNKPIQSNATNSFVFKPIVEVVNKPVNHFYYKIIASRANVFATPSDQSSVLSRAGFKGTEVEVIEFTNDKWCKVHLYNTTGYMHRKNLVYSRSNDTTKIISNTDQQNRIDSGNSMSDSEIVNYIRSNFKNADRSKYHAFDPEGMTFGISKIILIDYNNDDKKDALVYITGGLTGGNQGLWGFGLYKNIGNKLEYVDEIITSTKTIDSVVEAGNNITIYCREYSDNPPDPHCCPSLVKTYTLNLINDKIHGLE